MPQTSAGKAGKADTTKRLERRTELAKAPFHRDALGRPKGAKSGWVCWPVTGGVGGYRGLNSCRPLAGADPEGVVWGGGGTHW